MIVVASHNGAIGIKEAIYVLQQGSTAVDAVETGIHLVEANPDDHTVGCSGYPNLLGEIELDASIMNGCTYIIQTDDRSTPDEIARTCVPTSTRWDQ